MGAFSSFLIKIRKDQGFKSALSFYEYLSDRDGVTINYAQYKKIELGKTHPQPEFVRRIAKALPQHANALVQSFCVDIFPEQQGLFQTETQVAPPAAAPTGLLFQAEELTDFQVKTLSKTKIHYAVYLLLTLARRPLFRDDIASTLGFDLDHPVFKDFLDAHLIYEVEGKIRARAIERVFPKPDTPVLKKIYTQLDQWDLTMSDVFKMDTLMFRSMIRRVSPRYVPILMKNAELLIEQFRASDETDANRNNEVVSLILSVKRTKLPG